MTTITDHRAAQTAEYEALTPEQQDRLWDGGDVRGVPVRCDYCDRPVAWASPDPPNLHLACSTAAHIAWSQSQGSAVPVSAFRDNPVVDKSTLPKLPACGCPVYAENDGSFTAEHEQKCRPREPMCGRVTP